jgi:2-amino-4-hydroxy-6-hydroxymethyldihydropteridine diphosphokinase
MAATHTAYIALGSNLGDRAGNLRAAVDRLNATPGVRVTRVSPVFEYPAVDAPAGSPPFLNAAAAVETTLSPAELLRSLLSTEQAFGRVRSVRNAPRPLDLDVLLFDDRVLETPELRIPHPRMESRRFVLEPLAAIAPDVLHPVLKASISQLLMQVPPGT